LNGPQIERCLEAPVLMFIRKKPSIAIWPASAPSLTGWGWRLEIAGPVGGLSFTI